MDTVIRITLDLGLRRDDVDPDLTVKLDHHTLLAGPQAQDKVTVPWSGSLPPGTHRLGIHCHNIHRRAADAPEMAVIIDSVRFQSVDHEFRHHGVYEPCYPEIWAAEQGTAGVELPRQLHSHYLGWNGIWYLDFETPIYRWIHRRMDLGWLI